MKRDNTTQQSWYAMLCLLAHRTSLARLIPLLLTVMAATPLHAEQQRLQMEATLSHSEIFLGEAAYLTLHVHGYQHVLGQPDLSALSADITLLAQQDHSQQSIQIVNGVQHVTRISGRRFTYRIQPHASGTFQLSPILLKGPDGQPIPINDVQIRVLPIPVQDHVALWIETPTNHVMLDEPFDVVLKIRIRKPTRPFHTYSPIPNDSAPHLHIPYLDLHPAEGLQSENITQLLQRLLVSNGESFRINDRVSGRDPFGGMFGREQAARFRLERQTDPTKDAYFLYTLTSRWSADREGDYPFGPVRFRGQVITSVTPQGQTQHTNIYAMSDPAVVRVRLPPATGRPPTFMGATGANVTIQTELDTQSCQTGDPLTLTINITGDSPRNRILAPRPETLAPLEDDFRVTPEYIRSETIPNGKRFSYLIRPRQPGTLEIPALEIAFFNLATRTYQTATSDPLPLRVNPAEELDRGMVPGANHGRIRITASAAPGDLPPAPLLFGRSTTTTSIFRPPLHCTLLLMGPIFFLMVQLAQWLPKHVPAWKARTRKQQAFKLAMQKLQDQDASTRIVNILREYLSGAIDPAIAKGNTETIERALDKIGLSVENRHTIMHLLTHEAYTGESATHSVSEIQQLIQSVARQAKIHTSRRNTKARIGAPCLLALFAGSLALTTLATNVTQFEERRTNLLLQQAQETTEFLMAANALADRIDQGERHPQILYNLGTALLMAEQPALALPVLQWAERRGVSSWEVRRNMLLARRMITQDPTLQLPWIRKLLFWHYRLPVATRMTMAFSLFALIWIMAGLHRIRRKPVRIIPPIAVALFVLLAVSTAASFHAEIQSEHNWQQQRQQIQHILAILQQGDET